MLCIRGAGLYYDNAVLYYYAVMAAWSGLLNCAAESLAGHGLQESGGVLH